MPQQKLIKTFFTRNTKDAVQGTVSLPPKKAGDFKKVVSARANL